MKWKVVLGYDTTAAGHLAMERGEVNGATSSLNTLRTTELEWLQNGLIRILVQYALRRSPDLPDIPAVVEFGVTDEDKEVLGFYANSGAIGRTLIAPPNMAADTVSILRTGFDATMKDPEFLADIQAAKLEFEPLSGAQLQMIVEQAGRLSPGAVARARAARGQ